MNPNPFFRWGLRLVLLFICGIYAVQFLPWLLHNGSDKMFDMGIIGMLILMAGSMLLSMQAEDWWPADCSNDHRPGDYFATGRTEPTASVILLRPRSAHFNYNIEAEYRTNRRLSE